MMMLDKALRETKHPCMHIHSLSIVQDIWPTDILPTTTEISGKYTIHSNAHGTASGRTYHKK